MSCRASDFVRGSRAWRSRKKVIAFVEASVVALRSWNKPKGQKNRHANVKIKYSINEISLANKCEFATRTVLELIGDPPLTLLVRL